MSVDTRVFRAAAIACLLLATLGTRAEHALVLDMGSQIPAAKDVRFALFPEDGCTAAYESPGAGCPAGHKVVRYSLSAADFRLGSAELPDLLRRQLTVFGEVLRGRRAGQGQVSIESHADASSSAEQALQLSQRRAEAVKAFLVSMGVEPQLLQAVGKGALAPRQSGNPYAAQNRRIEIGRTSLN